jgi:hypothetical protein
MPPMIGAAIGFITSEHPAAAVDPILGVGPCPLRDSRRLSGEIPQATLAGGGVFMRIRPISPHEFGLTVARLLP